MSNAAEKLPPAQPVEDITTHATPMRHMPVGKMPLDAAVKTALADALAGKGKLPPHVLEMEGMSGVKYRRFINNLVQNVVNPRYLEVGSWAGSTLCSAIQGNDVTALAIDNWSLFGGPQNMFFANLARCCSPTTRISFLSADFRQVDFRAIGRHNIYLFDGPHAFEDQRDGLEMALDALENEFVFIVDDWNWEPVRAGTMTAIAHAGLSVMWSTEIRSTLDNTHPEIQRQHSDWHNGYYISILRK
jgi:hypothetical protein